MFAEAGDEGLFMERDPVQMFRVLSLSRTGTIC